MTAVLLVVAAVIGSTYGFGGGPLASPSVKGSIQLNAQVFRVASTSMEPTLQIGDQVAVSTGIAHLRRGDVVLVHIPRPSLPVTKVFKRVIGLPGETISSSGSSILVNGVPLSEPYLAAAQESGPPVASQVIPANEYFVLGDNRTNSLDSRFFGPVPSTSIIGIAQRIVAPRARSGPIAGS